MRKLRSALAQAVELQVCTHAHADAVWREVAGGSDTAERAAEVWLAAVSRIQTAQPTRPQTRHMSSPKRLSTSPSARSIRQYSPEVRHRTPSPRPTAAGPSEHSPRSRRQYGSEVHRHPVARRESSAKQYSPEVRHRLVARHDSPATQQSPRKPSDGIVATMHSGPSHTHVELGHRAVLKDHRDVLTLSSTTAPTGSPSSPAFSLERNKHMFSLSPSTPNLSWASPVFAVSDQEFGNTSSQTDEPITAGLAGNGVDGPAPAARRGKFSIERQSSPVMGAGVSAPPRRSTQPTRTVRETEVATGHPPAPVMSQQTQRRLPKHRQQHQDQQYQQKFGDTPAESSAPVEPALRPSGSTIASAQKPTPMTLAVAAGHVRDRLGLSNLPLIELINAGRLKSGLSPVDRTTPLKQAMAQLCDRLGIQTNWEQTVHTATPRPAISEDDDAEEKAAAAAKTEDDEGRKATENQKAAEAKAAADAAAAERAAEEQRAAEAKAAADAAAAERAAEEQKAAEAKAAADAAAAERAAEEQRAAEAKAAADAAAAERAAEEQTGADEQAAAMHNRKEQGEAAALAELMPEPEPEFYYAAANGQCEQPVTMRELALKLACHDVDWQTRVWSPGMAHWATFEDCLHNEAWADQLQQYLDAIEQASQDDDTELVVEPVEPQPVCTTTVAAEPEMQQAKDDPQAKATDYTKESTTAVTLERLWE